MKPTPTYAIRRWRRYFENSSSLKVKKVTWVPIPNKHDGATYRRVVEHPSCGQVFCGWTFILEVASKMPTRGVLHDGDGALRPVDLHYKTGIPEKIFKLAFEVLVDPEIGWLEVIDWPTEEYVSIWKDSDASGRIQTYLDVSESIFVEGKGTEGKDCTPQSPPSGGKGRKTSRKGGESKEVWKATKQIEMAQGELAEIENRTSQTATGPIYSDEDKKRRKELKGQIDELRKAVNKS